MTALKTSNASLYYTCGCCGKRLTKDNYYTYINDDMKLVLTAICCGHSAQFKVWLDMGGTLFKDPVPSFIEDRG